MVNTRLLLTFILLLNHSLMYGVTSAAHIPDENHPLGYGSLTQNHEHTHDHESLSSHDRTHDQTPGQTADQLESAGDVSSQSDHHHEHGAHVHLNCDLPYSLSIDFYKPGSQELSNYQFQHQNLSYSPPVPPPNR